jgi:DNA helicase-2/ATP-dependent DNA helicase PcrA
VRREDLTRPQLDAVTSTEAVVLVLGGPGTGKTTTALWAAREILEVTSSPVHVLFLTFSRTAVMQVRRRMPGVFGKVRERVEVSTFHGFAYRLLCAFGQYCGRGRAHPRLQSEAEARLTGPDRARLSYDDLLPQALRLLQSNRIRRLLNARWPLVVCDEFQDTGDDQWRLLRLLGEHARLMLMADANQMIYTFLRRHGVGPRRLDEARALATRVIDLGVASHRDPSGAIPALADAVRRRVFDDDAILTAVDAGRLRVVASVDDGDLTGVVRAEVASLRLAGCRSIGIFAHSNDGVAALSSALAESGLDHVLIGIPESHAEALAAMGKLCAYGVGLASALQARTALGVFLTSCTRGTDAPELARRLALDQPLDRGLETLFQSLQAGLVAAAQGTIGELVGVAAGAWPGLAVRKGGRPWRRSAPVFLSIAQPLAQKPASVEVVSQLLQLIERRRPRALVEFDTVHQAPIQLMNFHQTKGREADAVLLVYREGDYLADARAREPFEEASRVLFVSLTRARERVVVVLPRRPHPLVSPLARWA